MTAIIGGAETMVSAPPSRGDEPDGAPRLAILDILRGIAILSILFMNVEAMGGPFNAVLLGDPRFLGWTGGDQVAWWIKDVLAEGTARCLLEILFGAGMVILTDRAATRMEEWRVLRGYAWRNVVLFMFGLAHVFLLLWPGDILHTYGLAALVAMTFRRLRPRLLLTIGLAMATAQLVGASSYVVSAKIQRQVVAEVHAKQRAGIAPTATDRQTVATFAKRQARRAVDRAEIVAAMAAENEARRGDAWGWATSLWGSFVKVETMGLELLFVWEAASTMLIGAALFRLGVLQGEHSRRFYAWLTLAGYGVGLPLRIWGAYTLTRFDHLPTLAVAFGEYARLFVTLGHLGAIVLLAGSAAGVRLGAPFKTAGRAALSIYVLQTIATMWVLYPPWGLALYGRQGWAVLMLTALAIDAVLLLAAVWWMRHFAIAPVEWAWRSIVARRSLPWRHAPHLPLSRSGSGT